MGLPAFSDSGNAAPKLFGDITDPANLSVQLPALSATLPFLFLIMVTLRLPLANPSAVFGLALLLVILLFGMSEILLLDVLPVVGLVSVLPWNTRGIFNISIRRARRCPALVPRVLPGVHDFSFHFSSEVRGKTSPGLQPRWLVRCIFIWSITSSARLSEPILGLVPAAFTLPSLLGLLVLSNGHRSQARPEMVS